MKKTTRAGPVIIPSLLLLLAGNAVLAQALQSGPAIETGGPGLALLSQDDPFYDPYTLHFTPLPGPNGELPPETREALYDYRLTVRPDGSVDDIEILGGFYDRRFERMMRDTVEQTRFKPATAGGEPVEWPHLDIRVVVRGAWPPGVDDEMRAEFNELVQLMTAKDYRGAERFADNLIEDDVLRLFELALIKDQLATIYAETERLPEALVASRLATMRSPAVLPAPDAGPEALAASFPNEFLTPDLHFSAQRKHFILALLANQTGEALAIHADMQEEAARLGQEAELADVARQVDTLKTVLASDGEVGSAIKLVDGSWHYTMSNRRIFGVTGLDGRVDFIDVNCANSVKRRMVFQNDSEWRIPESWGQCVLEFRGRDNSRFNLYEYLN